VGIPNHKEEIRVLSSDIHYIKTKEPVFKKKNNALFGSPLFYTGIISPFFGLFLFVLLYRKQKEKNKDVVAVKSRAATKMAKKRLSIAEKHLNAGNKELFYEEIFRALYGYIGDKLNIPSSDQNKEYITEKLKMRQVSETTIASLIGILDNCSYARYAPSAVSGDLGAIYNKTVELITQIEDEIR
jgi:hypothetical protein